MRKFDFVRVAWDNEHSEITAYRNNGEPFGQREFPVGTRTRNAFIALEMYCMDLDDFEFSLAH